jgi:hypothetical protein
LPFHLLIILLLLQHAAKTTAQHSFKARNVVVFSSKNAKDDVDDDSAETESFE